MKTIIFTLATMLIAPSLLTAQVEISDKPQRQERLKEKKKEKMTNIKRKIQEKEAWLRRFDINEDGFLDKAERQAMKQAKSVRKEEKAKRPKKTKKTPKV